MQDETTGPINGQRGAVIYLKTKLDSNGHGSATINRMSTVAQDLRYALRLLWKSPGFTAAAILALALGIGANTAIFSVVNSVVLRPLPFRDANRMVVVWESNQAQGMNRVGPSGPTFLDWRDQSQSFEDLALLEPGTGTLTGSVNPSSCRRCA